jgi:hypothetical protein
VHLPRHADPHDRPGPPVVSVSTADRLLVLARSNGVCEVCGQARATNVHHRMPRGMGGTNRPIESPAWLLHVCGSGTTGCHGRIESDRTRAQAAGWLLVGQETPETRPARLWFGTVVLDDQGDYLPVPCSDTGVSSRDG